MLLPEKKSTYTFSDMLGWDENERVEIINGQALLMAAPSRVHQEICFEIGRQLGNFLEGKQCRVYPAPFGVRLFEQDGDDPKDTDTVVEPDISVICDRSKLDKYGCRGAPEMIVEVLSPASQRHDQLIKLNLYQRAGVLEYWIVDPENKTVRVMLRADSGLLQTHEVYRQDDLAKVSVLDGCFIELSKVFSE